MKIPVLWLATFLLVDRSIITKRKHSKTFLLTHQLRKRKIRRSRRPEAGTRGATAKNPRRRAGANEPPMRGGGGARGERKRCGASRLHRRPPPGARRRPGTSSAAGVTGGGSTTAPGQASWAVASTRARAPQRWNAAGTKTAAPGKTKRSQISARDPY